MAKYLITKPWSFTVKSGDVIESDDLHPSLTAHVQRLPDDDEKELEVATPSKRGRKPKSEQEQDSDSESEE